MNLLKEARRLHQMGFAILWLHPRSKRPVGSEWTSGPRKEWSELKESFQPGYNVGVRLGGPSRIGENYLTVIDVDIKSTTVEHRKEAEAALRKIVGKSEFPEVRSGRGNGSRHIYCLTDQPFKTWNPSESEDIVKVKMPSKSPSKKEIEELSEKEIRDGWRLSRAWEISLYSDGRQVVLPPSIHPDTGKPYVWKVPLAKAGELAVVDFGMGPKEKAIVKPATGERRNQVVDDFEIDETIDVRWIPNLDKGTRDLIVKGIWKGEKITDRSAYLLPATSGLISAGLNKNEILTVLTDPTTVLGQCAYDHAGNTTSRKRAAQWIWSYTVKKVLSERSGNVFKGVPVEGLDDSDGEDKSGSEPEWMGELDRERNGKIKPALFNCVLILKNAGGPGIVGRDEFAVNDFYLADSPWRSKKGDAVTDIDIVRVKTFCATQFNVEFGDNTILQALMEIADVNRFHPVREYLQGLEWDGEPRIETWLMDYAGATGPEKYVRAISRKLLVAMVKRVMEPGCKFDHVVILEGLQGAGKSTLLSNLTGKWFTDQPLVIGDKDAVLTMQSKWLIELGELAALNRGELEAMKAFVTQRTDRIRAPYGRKVEEHPRQSVFVGSTNLDEYLKDETGNRRFWPIKCGEEIDFNGVKDARDQLFAEAVQYYMLKEPLYLETPELVALAKVEQETRNESDEWFGAVADVINGELFPNKFEMRDVTKLLDASFGANRLDKGDQMRLGKILKLLGCTRFQEKKGARRKLWRKTKMEPLEPPPNHLGGSTKDMDIKGFY